MIRISRWGKEKREKTVVEILTKTNRKGWGSSGVSIHKRNNIILQELPAELHLRRNQASLFQSIRYANWLPLKKKYIAFYQTRKTRVLGVGGLVQEVRRLSYIPLKPWFKSSWLHITEQRARTAPWHCCTWPRPSPQKRKKKKNQVWQNLCSQVGGEWPKWQNTEPPNSARYILVSPNPRSWAKSPASPNTLQCDF